MTVWPNWVDLVLLFLMLRACYIGLVRGYVLEAVLLLGVVATTALACNGYGYLKAFGEPWWPFGRLWLDAVSMALLLGAGLAISYLAMRRVASLITQGRLHWLLQGIGMVLGAVRGLWICGLLVLALLSVGNAYLAHSVEQRSILSPRLAEGARTSFQWMADRFPGRAARPQPPFLLTSRAPARR